MLSTIGLHCKSGQIKKRNRTTEKKHTEENAKACKETLNTKNEKIKLIKKFKISIGTKQLKKKDNEDMMKNKDKLTTVVARKISYRNPSASTIPNEVTVSVINNEHVSSLAMLSSTHLIHVQIKAKLQKKSEEQRTMMT